LLTGASEHPPWWQRNCERGIEEAQRTGLHQLSDVYLPPGCAYQETESVPIDYGWRRAGLNLTHGDEALAQVQRDVRQRPRFDTRGSTCACRKSIRTHPSDELAPPADTIGMTSLHLIAALPLRPAQTIAVRITRTRSGGRTSVCRGRQVTTRLGNGRMIRYAATRA